MKAEMKRYTNQDVQEALNCTMSSLTSYASTFLNHSTKDGWTILEIVDFYNRDNQKTPKQAVSAAVAEIKAALVAFGIDLNGKENQFPMFDDTEDEA